MVTLREQVADRCRKLQLQRTEAAARCQGELARLDAEIAACLQLRDTWDTTTVDQALLLLRQAGVGLTFS